MWTRQPIEVLARGTEADFIRECVDCGQWTGRFCDYCLAADRIPGEKWADGQATPLCSLCDNSRGKCHYCFRKHWCTPWPWGFNQVDGKTWTWPKQLADEPIGNSHHRGPGDSPPQHARDDQDDVLQAKAEAFEDVDADESDEPAERNDTETSSIDDGCLVEGHFAERLSVLGESGLCKEKPSNERKQKKQRIDGTFAGAPRDAYVPRWQVIALLKDAERKIRKGQAYMPRGQVVRLLKDVGNIIETGCPPETCMSFACPPATAAAAASASAGGGCRQFALASAAAASTSASAAASATIEMLREENMRLQAVCSRLRQTDHDAHNGNNPSAGQGSR